MQAAPAAGMEGKTCYGPYTSHLISTLPTGRNRLTQSKEAVPE